MSTCIRSIFLLLVLGVAVSTLSHAQETRGEARKSESAFEISIPAGPLVQALDRLGAQSRMQILYEPVLAQGVKVQGVNGTLTFRAALAQLLANTSLKVETVNEKTVILKRSDAATSMLSPADQMRMADNTDSGRAGPASAAENPEDKRNQMTVEGQRARGKPFADGDMDLPRAVDDAQPYYIFDAETIDRSGATNIEDFLKQRLTMNTTVLTNGQSPGSTLGNTSGINLRGLGTDKTLILVNGRRMAGVSHGYGGFGADYQPDLNGIPLGSIERIEVLPSSASGIYGGSAIGGVINVILKRDYAGGEVRATYDNSWDGDSPRRNMYLSYGLGLEGGRTHLTFNTAWSDEEPLLLRDRVRIYEEHLANINSRYPTFVYDNIGLWPGNLPNITSNDFSATTLTLKDGEVPLNSLNTHVSAGTSPGSTARDAGLLANAGQWNLDFPASTQSPTGLLREFGSPTTTRAFQAGVRRQMLPRWEVFADFAYSGNRTRSIGNPVNSILFVGADVPTNPFTTDVKVQVPDASEVPVTTRAESRSATLGTLVQLPGDWTGALDYTWSENRLDYRTNFYDSNAQAQDISSGALDPFVDTLLYPVNLQKYLVPITYSGSNRLQDITLRGSGPLPALPWGAARLTIGLEHRMARTPTKNEQRDYPLTPANNTAFTYYDRDSTTDSGYMEATLPLVKSGWLPGLHMLELQLSGRRERYEVDTGTPYEFTFYNQAGAPTYYGTPTLDGEPYFSRASYSSSNYTLGLKYQPVEQVTLRVSRATAFLPPLPSQLLEDPSLPPTEYVVDPTLTSPPAGCSAFGPTVFCPVAVRMGGNPELKPQNSRSLNAGIIWEPSWRRLAGLRLDAEYYRIEQFDAIDSLETQVIVDNEAAYPGRVVRDGAGKITEVNASLLNLYHRETEGWDFSADYTVETSAGQFNLHAVSSIIRHLKNQYSQTLPAYESVNFPSEGGAAKYKTNATLSWEAGQWMMAWTARYLGSYSQYGADGGPNATQRASSPRPTPPPPYLDAQGSDTVPSQIYHDLLLGYTLDRGPVKGLALQLSVRNIFDKVAPLDAFYDSNYYMSPYGDVRLRSYWLSARLGF